MTDTKYFVKEVKTCLKCNGEGVVEHPAWEAYWEANEHKGVTMLREEDLTWFRERGWVEYLQTGITGLPDEEITCETCDGTGSLVNEVDLLEVLPKLLEVMRNTEVES